MSLAKSLRRKAERLKLSCPDMPYLPDQALDGMPRSPNINSSVEGLVMARERHCEAMVARAEMMFKQAEEIQQQWGPWNRALDFLPAMEQAVLRMRYLEGMGVDAVAKELDTTRSTVYNSENRALLALWRMVFK